MRFICSVTSLLILGSCKGDHGVVPVFLLDYGGVMNHLKIEPNPFSKITTTFFTDVVQDVIKNSNIAIIFIENTFSPEDISTKDNKGTVFSHLRDGVLHNQIKYFPAVIEPYKTLRQTFQLHDLNIFYISDTNMKIKMYDTNYKHYYVYFVDGLNETRTDVLKRHDKIIKEVYSAVQQLTSGPVVAFYTGKTNPIKIQSLKITPLRRPSTSPNPGVTIESRGALFRFIGVYSTTASRYARFSQIPVVEEETWTPRQLSTTVAYSDFDLQFNFSFRKEGWTVDNVALLEGGEEVGRSELGVGAPWDWSYVCGEPLVVINTRDGSAVTISHYQIQPFKRSGRSDYNEDWSGVIRADEGDAAAAPQAPPPADTNPNPPPPADKGAPDTPKSFGKSVNCGPYFNSVILAGLFVTFICLGVLACAVSAMYNCHSNDKYDDPQGKALTIAGEGTH
ncbi:unnamed protein product [Parnassius mnemosyne]|uniref:V-type proton ATPase subunit S1/VOA1 transmembrane domain-containing protein n=1 Tax=Parnassius mnemosyne TaxID=213953 RepID=A0AAV1L0T1_9NEOP